ncbi:hypothetical protein EQW76_00860 [Rhizobium sp. rho-13.1]|uniref:hypothetical protein n=1 Tax=Rhizobium sp. rho-13.1 TaxID=2506431 RepID=UPI00115C783B|nr:hypothetical protein [Rhizobium sp. rho-13.1]TQX91317.1 hypothetical protein EQW76_00860 [Rhizobium sp. rho-13.1]
MADDELTDREIYALLDKAHGLFKGQKGATEGGQAVVELFLRNTDMIQRAMVIMLEKGRPQSEPEP